MKFSVASLLTVTFLAPVQVMAVFKLGGVPVHIRDHFDSVSNIKNATFQQTLNHSDPNSPTFSQTYYYDTTFWKGPGSPIVMFAPQEANASDYLGLLTNSSMTGLLAQEIGAATVIMEHRYWGNSSPFPKLSTKNMAYQTLDNAIADCNNFAQKVQFPFAKKGSNAKDVPWVLIGGSYSGALAAWIEAKAPGTFWAYLSSSGVVQTISDLWQYFAQVERAMPRNCSADVQTVISHMDNVLETGSQSEIHALKAKFGLQSVEHNDDFMEVLANGPYLWQGTQFFFDAGFFQWCDYIENSVNQTNKALLPGAKGVGLEKALDGYANWTKTVFLPNFCHETYGYEEFKGVHNVACFDTYNPKNPIFTDMTVSNTADRQWLWFLCNEPFGYWQDGAPQGTPTIVSRLVSAQYQYRQCGLYFPPGPQGQTYGIAKGRTEDEVNAYTGGWNIDNTTRLIYTNGGLDPWRDCTVSSLYRPGGPLASTSQVPVHLVKGGIHCSDLDTKNGLANAGCHAIQQAELSQLKQWVSEFPKSYYHQ